MRQGLCGKDEDQEHQPKSQFDKRDSLLDRVETLCVLR